MSRRALSLSLLVLGLAGCVYDVPLLSSAAVEQTDARAGGMPDDPGANGRNVAEDAGRPDSVELPDARGNPDRP